MERGDFRLHSHSCDIAQIKKCSKRRLREERIGKLSEHMKADFSCPIIGLIISLERKLSNSINFMWLPPTRNLPPGVKMGNLTKEQQRSYSLGQYENFSPPMINSDYLENGEDYNIDDNNPYNNTNFNGINYSNQKGLVKKLIFNFRIKRIVLKSDVIFHFT
jgi:hypothetical protein